MTIDTHAIRTEPHVTVGFVIHRDADIVIGLWSRRAVAEQPNAQRVHHATLLDHLPAFLRELGKSLAESDDAGACRHCHPAHQHGEQRWQSGWSLTEVIQDYQILRLVLVEYLEEVLGRPMLLRETMAVGLALDEAIASSISAFVNESAERVRRAEEALHRKAEALREASERKDEFLAVLGHELRNPLAPLRNALQVLGLRGGDAATVEWARAMMDRQVQHLTHLVNDLLDIARISRGKITLQRERLDLVRLVGEVVSDQQGSITEAGLTLSLELPSLPIWVEGDPVRLAQVIGNLVQNATKFTDRGGQVTVQVTREDDRHALVLVRDSGIGIEPELLPRVFELYEQGHLSPDRGGLGLGLALAKGLIELHGGAIQAVSEGPGRGSEFTVRLPQSTGATAPLKAAPPAHLGGVPLTVVVIEDDRDSGESMRLLLEILGHQVTLASSGIAGVEAVRRLIPALVLCDLGLPGMDGYAVAQALRSDPATASIRLVAVSGYAQEEDRQRCREAGFDLHLGKPVDFAELERVLAGSAEKRGSAKPTDEDAN